MGKAITSIGTILSLQDRFRTGLLNCANSVGLSLISLACSVFSLLPIGGLMSHRRCVAGPGDESHDLILS